MTSENYAELYEAVYLYDKLPRTPGGTVDRAVKRILTVCGLRDNTEERRNILDNIIGASPKRYEDFLKKAADGSRFFFNELSELEYEIYSRCNFQVTYETGKEVIKHINFTNCNMLELGGNSGGFASAVLEKYKGCRYTVVDTKVPCAVGAVFAEDNGLDIRFIEGDAFKLTLPDKRYDYIVLMNLLHDYNDEKCLDILRGCRKYLGGKLLIIEDILAGEYEPAEAVMHGLRLSAECAGGRQRTAEEYNALLSKVNCKIKDTITLSGVHTMLIAG